MRQLRTVDAGVTGPPVIGYEASRLMEAAYSQGTLYAVVLVGALTILTLRRVPEALLAMTPLALGTLWTVGVMRLFGLPFNLANVWALPLIVGASAEYGLNVTLRIGARCPHRGSFSRPVLASQILTLVSSLPEARDCPSGL